MGKKRYTPEQIIGKLREQRWPWPKGRRRLMSWNRNLRYFCSKRLSAALKW